MEKTRQHGCITHFLQDKYLVKDRPVLIVDDIIDSGATINSAADLLYNSGAKSITVLGIHGILSRREFSHQIDMVYVTNTIKQETFIQPQVVDVDKIIQSRIAFEYTF
jgi:phosphoribosylpyrophosphate synthetase